MHMFLDWNLSEIRGIASVCHIDIHIKLLYCINILNTISARQIQREYKKVFERANKSKEPIVVMSNNKPQAAIISLDLLEKIRLDAALAEALGDYKAGRVKTISTQEELEAEFEEMGKEAGLK